MKSSMQMGQRLSILAYDVAKSREAGDSDQAAHGEHIERLKMKIMKTVELSEELAKSLKRA